MAKRVISILEGWSWRSGGFLTILAPSFLFSGMCQLTVGKAVLELVMVAALSVWHVVVVSVPGWRERISRRVFMRVEAVTSGFVVGVLLGASFFWCDAYEALRWVVIGCTSAAYLTAVWFVQKRGLPEH